MQPNISGFFDDVTNTVSYIVADPETKACAIIDSVLDFDLPSAHTTTRSADKLIAEVEKRGLKVEWVLETHAHADHLSAGPYLQKRLGGKTAIGQHIATVQETWKSILNLEPELATDGSQFDHLFAEGDTFSIGNLQARVMHTPGHTPACSTYVIGDTAFVGDTLFMPDYGTARCDFPGGSARQLYQSISKILALPDETRIFLCHDYLTDDRKTHEWETTVGEQRRANIHVKEGTSEEEYVNFRTERDAGLNVPYLLIPSIQINIRAGALPPAEKNGTSYLKFPLNTL